MQNLQEVDVNIAWKKKYPEQIVFAVSWDEKNNRSNIITLGWVMPTSHNPPLIAISIGNTRYSFKTISETNEFVISFPTEKMAREVLYCGTRSGKDVDKFKETGLTSLPSKYIKPPLIKECLVNMECKVVNKVVTGDHTIFIGEILTAYISESKERRIFTLSSDWKFGGL